MKTLKQLALENEELRMRITALETAVTGAGIVIPPTPIQLARMAQADEQAMQQAAARWE